MHAACFRVKGGQFCVILPVFFFNVFVALIIQPASPAAKLARTRRVPLQAGGQHFTKRSRRAVYPPFLPPRARVGRGEMSPPSPSCVSERPNAKLEYDPLPSPAPRFPCLSSFHADVQERSSAEVEQP